jgi:hypothetical protein
MAAISAALLLNGIAIIIRFNSTQERGGFSKLRIENRELLVFEILEAPWGLPRSCAFLVTRKFHYQTMDDAAHNQTKSSRI